MLGITAKLGYSSRRGKENAEFTPSTGTPSSRQYLTVDRVNIERFAVNIEIPA
jgi:hypothetical protein